MSQGDQDKTEQPTPFRLDEARKQGNVAKSPEVTGIVVMIAFAVIMALSGTQIARAVAQATGQMIAVAGHAPSLDAALTNMLHKAYAPLWQALAPLVLGLIVAGAVGNLAQTGPMFTTHPLKPDFKRMHPMQVVRKIFSMRTLWELGKLLFKSALLLGLAALVVLKARALIESVAGTAPNQLGGLMARAFVKTSLYVLLVLAIAALADWLFSRREFMRKMRMSKRELKDEVKRRDGDPTVKTKQKQLLRELLKKAGSVGRVKDADVILTNPTHVAVALRYRPGETLAPVVVSKGAGLMAAEIRKRARQHKVPMVRNPALARALFKECGIDEMIPQARYSALVPIYRELWASLGTPGGAR